MPLLKPRPGVNDGGYAVEDYRAVDPRVGTMDDLETLAGAIHANDMNMCIDLVLNHTAKEHEWARKAFAGDSTYLDYYYATMTAPSPTLLRRLCPKFSPISAGQFYFL